MLKPAYTKQFKKDYKKAVKRGLEPEALETALRILCEERPLPAPYRDHALVNSRHYKNMRECHIAPDWLLVYQVIEEELILKLVRTGTHSDLF